MTKTINIPKPKTPGVKPIKRLLVLISLLISLVIIATFWWFNSRTSRLIKAQLQHQAASYFEEIVLIRQWLAQHGGVYVPQRAGVEINPYLQKIPGIEARITDIRGRDYVLKNPALVTRELSELGREAGEVQFHITSLRPLNPANKPDQFEADALKRFRHDPAEAFRMEQRPEGTFFRYMQPLITTTACLPCHEAQGYHQGDIRGGISITIPADRISRQLIRNQQYTLLAALSLVVLVVTILILISRMFIKDLRIVEQKLYELASKDLLTGLLSRREGMKRLREEISKSSRIKQPLAIILADIDHFKAINDSLGHKAGDKVLQHLGKTMMAFLRDYDIICRYGGEEFLLVLPEADLDGAADIASRLQKEVENLRIAWQEGMEPVSFTLSQGVAQLQQMETLDELILRSDRALYKAKETGRNRVSLATTARK